MILSFRYCGLGVADQISDVWLARIEVFHLLEQRDGPLIVMAVVISERCVVCGGRDARRMVNV